MSLSEAIAAAAARDEVKAEVLEAAFSEIMAGEASPVRIAALLVALRVKGETVNEIVAVARALRAVAAGAPPATAGTVDTCGTGGTGKDTFSISTTSAFVVAGAGVPVAKHGNRAVTGQAGSFDTLEALGVRIDLPVSACAQILGEIGIAPFFARTAHPAFRHVGPVRQELGVRTLLNCVGPLLNPVGVRHQLVGVYEASLVEPLAQALGRLGALRALVVHGRDGLDELTTTDTSLAVMMREGQMETLEVDPQALGLPRARPEDLAGGDAEENAELLKGVLKGEEGPRRDIVCLNSAGALWAAGTVESLAEGIERAAESIDSGAALGKLSALVAATAASGEAHDDSD